MRDDEPTNTDRASATAERLARAMPFTHHPAKARLESVLEWGELRSRSMLGAPPERADDASKLRADHVFAYAGPACYLVADGVVVLVFGTELDELTGHIAPFDTGALLEPNPRLRPRCLQRAHGSPGGPDDHAFVAAQSHALAGWRDHFQAWLLASYDDPARYLENLGDASRDGVPDRFHPEELRDNHPDASPLPPPTNAPTDAPGRGKPASLSRSRSPRWSAPCSRSRTSSTSPR